MVVRLRLATGDLLVVKAALRCLMLDLMMPSCSLWDCVWNGLRRASKRPVAARHHPTRAGAGEQRHVFEGEIAGVQRPDMVVV